nr:YCF48-related protein [uncultured Roseateles sp.]
MMITSFFRRWLMPLMLLAGLSARAAAPTPLALVPAQRVAHAGQALLLASARAGDRLVLVGEHGVVMLSDDGGRSFRQAGTVPVDSTLTGVSFADARQGWAVGHWGVILATRDGGETWTLQRSDVSTDRPLFAVHFLDAQRGVAVGLWSLVLVTEDGGAHWQAVTPPAPEGATKADLNLLGLFADARGRVYATAEKGMLLRSDDGGQHWRYLATGYKGSFWTGLATAEGSLLAAGLRGSLYRSTDEGRSWARLETGAKASITGMAAVGTALVAVGADGLVLRSVDGGASFSATPRADRLPLTSVIASRDGRAVMTSRQGIVSDGQP